MSSCRICLVLLFLGLLAVPATYAQDDELQAKINQAIDRGVSNLKRAGGEQGVWRHQHHSAGMTALAAWTLLESGVSPKDEQVQRSAAYLRKQAIEQNHTYTLALMVIFFDRLGDPGDEVLIQALGVRLLAGQFESGSWTYTSDFGIPVNQDWVKSQQRWLQSQIEEADQQRRDKTAPAAKKELLPQIQKQVDKVSSRLGGGDNSNTQFAMLGLWVAKRHGLPVTKAIERVEKRFRRMQLNGGGWNYSPEVFFGPPRATMTCAGLLGLALGQGIKPKKEGQGEMLKKDPMVKNAFALLADVLKDPDSDKSKHLLEKPGNFNYFLFSLERMAVVYDVKKIGDTDWYTWGAKMLVDKQKSDGSWPGEYGAADTCFALLFLKRANVAEDLTLNLNPLAKPSKKKKLKDDPKDDPFDLPDKEKKKKIKIRPKDKDSGQILRVPKLLFGNASDKTPLVTDLADRRATWASVPPVRRSSW